MAHHHPAYMTKFRMKKKKTVNALVYCCEFLNSFIWFLIYVGHLAVRLCYDTRTKTLLTTNVLNISIKNKFDQIVHKIFLKYWFKDKLLLWY